MRITENDLWRFTKGDCHVLAKRLHRIAGLPMHVLVVPDTYDESGRSKLSRHAFVMLGNKILDVEGLWKKKDFIERWKHDDGEVIWISKEVSVGWFKANWNPKGAQFGHYSYLRARQIANHLVKEHCIDFLSSRDRVS